MKRFIGGPLVVLVGVAFILAIFIPNSLFSSAPPFERLTDEFRPIMTEGAITTLKADVARLEAVEEEFGARIVPTLAQAFEQTPQQFQAFIAQAYPDVAAGVQDLPQITAAFDRVIESLEQERARFVSADAIPTGDLTSRTVPWGILIAGIATILVGVGLTIMVGRTMPILAIVVGVITLATVLSLNLHTKAANADTLNENLEPIYTAELVTQAQTNVATLTAMAGEIRTEMLPAVAQRLNLQQEQFEAFVAQRFPALADAIENLEPSLTRVTDAVGRFSRALPDFRATQDVRLQPVAWTLIAGSSLTILVALWALLAWPGRARVVLDRETAREKIA